MVGKEDSSELYITLTADIVSAHVSNNTVAVSDIPLLIGNVHTALAALSGNVAVAVEPPVPAVPVKSSVKAGNIVCLDCGAKLKMLKRHISTHHGLSVDEYRERWALPKDYPMVAPDYAVQRRKLAVEIGLGKNGRGGKKRK